MLLKKGPSGLFLIFIDYLHTISSLIREKLIRERRDILNGKRKKTVSVFLAAALSVLSAAYAQTAVYAQTFEAAEHGFETTEAHTVKTVIPSGRSIGVILDTDGVIVTELEAFDTDGGRASPARDAGIAEGDIITEINGKRIKSTAEFEDTLKELGGEDISAEIMRKDKKMSLLIKPALSKNNKSCQIGAEVRDAATGIGTMTFYDPHEHTFAALGHGICSAESGETIPSSGGKILASDVVAVKKGERGSPGELKGVFGEDGEILGSISFNGECGIFGKYFADTKIGTETEISPKSAVHTGKAYIRADVGDGSIGEYEVEITRVMTRSTAPSKGMIIKIRDERLIKKTGGIVRGMSGSPIIQDGKLIGAVTHVFVNDPTKGYGIFIENMLAETEKIK